MAKEFKSNVNSSADSWQVLLTSTGSSILTGLLVASTINTGVTVDVRITKAIGGAQAYLGLALPVPLGSALQVVSGEKIVLEDGDTIEVKSSSSDTSGHNGGNIDTVLSYMENVNNPPV